MISTESKDSESNKQSTDMDTGKDDTPEKESVSMDERIAEDGNNDETLSVQVESKGPTTPLTSRLKKVSESSSKKRKRVEFSEDKPQLEVFEIEEGNRFNKLPSQDKQKAQANKWTNVFTISATKKKKIRVDEVEVAQEAAEDKRASEEAAKAKEEAAATAAAEKASAEKAKEEAAAPTTPAPKPLSAEELAKLTDEEKEALFKAAVERAFLKLLNNGKMLQLNFMVKDLKASGLMDFIKTKHGGIKKWFLQTDDFGLNVRDNFVGFKGHNEAFLEETINVLRRAPKYMLKIHQLLTSLRQRVSENGVKKGLRGYPDLQAYIEANNNIFLVSKKGGFVTVRDQYKTPIT